MFRGTRGNAKGVGLLNSVINALPFELHVPGYQFCGPGTQLAKRLARGDRGVNPLDAACRQHDIAYSQSNELVNRHAADRDLDEEARKRITASDSTLGERLAAATVWAAMKAKTKLGWTHQIGFEDLVREMVESDCRANGVEQALRTYA